MEEMANLINNVARFLAFGIGGVSVIVFIYAGFLFMTASGDPQKTGQARQALMGAFIGLIITGAAFVLPRIISQAIIEPAGGVSIVTEGQVACDSLLEDQLVAQRGANNGERMNEVIRLIQNRQECTADIWNPFVLTSFDWDGAGNTSGTPDATGGNAACFGGGDATTATDAAKAAGAAIGGNPVPLGLRDGQAVDGVTVERSFRDASNNILVVFWNVAADNRRPSDNSNCWLYLARLRSWGRSY